MVNFLTLWVVGTLLSSCGQYDIEDRSDRRALRTNVSAGDSSGDQNSADAEGNVENSQGIENKNTASDSQTSNNDEDTEDESDTSNEDEMSDLLDPAANGDPNIVVFRIQPGTNGGAWNDPDNPIRAFVGQTVRFVNDDTESHYLHSNNSSGPCPHGTGAFGPGETYDCVINRVYNTDDGIRTWDHADGEDEAPIYMNLTNNALALSYAHYDDEADRDLPPPKDCGVDH